MISIPLDPLSSTWLVSDLQERLAWSKLSAPGCRCLISVSSTLGYKLGCHSGTDGSSVMGDYVEVWCVPSATSTSCILCKIQTEVLGIRRLVTFSKTPLYIYVCIIYLYMNMSASSESTLVRLPVSTHVTVFLNLILFCNLLYWYYWTWNLLNRGPLYETIVLSKCTWTLSCFGFHPHQSLTWTLPQTAPVHSAALWSHSPSGTWEQRSVDIQEQPPEVPVCELQMGRAAPAVESHCASRDIPGSETYLGNCDILCSVSLPHNC